MSTRKFFEWGFLASVSIFILMGWIISFDPRWAGTRFYAGLVWLMNQFMFFGSMTGMWIFITSISYRDDRND